MLAWSCGQYRTGSVATGCWRRPYKQSRTRLILTLRLGSGRYRSGFCIGRLLHDFLRVQIRCGLVGNPIPSEDFHDVLGRSYYGRYIETNVNSARTKPLFLYVVTGKSNGKDGANNRNCLEEFLYNRPTHSAFDCLRHRSSYPW
jgi:hypothetical protein